METIGLIIALVIAIAGALFIQNKLTEVEAYSNLTIGLGFFGFILHLIIGFFSFL